MAKAAKVKSNETVTTPTEPEKLIEVPGEDNIVTNQKTGVKTDTSAITKTTKNKTPLAGNGIKFVEGQGYIVTSPNKGVE